MDDVLINENKQDEWQESLARQKERRIVLLKEDRERFERDKRTSDWKHIFG